MGVRVREKPIGSGVYWIFIHHHGKRKSKKIGNEDTANKVAEKIKAHLTLGGFEFEEKKDIPTFNKMAGRWLAVHVKQSRRFSTHERYQNILKKHINPAIGKIEIDRINRAEVIKTLRNIQGKGLSRSSVCVACNVISGVCEFAIDEEYINENPCMGVMKRLGVESWKNKTPVTVFTRAESELVLAECKKYRPDLYPLFLTAFRTGMRLGELLALQWSDVNWRNRYIMVQRSFKNGRISPTKNGRGRRIDMTDQLFSTLKGLSVERKKEALRNGQNEPVPVIFHTDGKPISQNTIRNIWKRLLNRAKLEYRKIHTIRHTFASMLISNGESLAYVKDLMGHSSIKITCDIYGHILPSENRNTLNCLDAPNRTPGAPLENKKAVTR